MTAKKERKLSEKELKIQANIDRIDLAIAASTKTLLQNLYVDDIEQAWKVMERLRGEEHVRASRAERHELEFFSKRRAELLAELAAAAPSEVANG